MVRLVRDLALDVLVKVLAALDEVRIHFIFIERKQAKTNNKL
jgi:hypothetical protein